MPAATAKRQRGALMIWLVLLAVLIGAAIGGALVALWVFRNVDARLLLSNQPAKITIDEKLQVTARALDNLNIRLDDTIQTKVPVDQIITVPVKEQLKVMADFDGTIPIKMDVAVRDKIVLDQVLDLNAVVDAEILGDKLKLPIRGKVPVKAIVPVSLDIPVDQPVKLKFTAPVGVRVQQALTVPLVTVIDAAIPIQADLSVPVRSDIPAEAIFTRDPIAATIVESDLRLPLRTLRLEVKDDGARSDGAASAP
ncbi:MAG: hypothetical protein K0Q76_3659 [Panacagrimonas sp.]|nr:hypothetical protein [Panacagrimonas sp.]MCC2658551.1 hypothetical protein [Panacagrimonas sp.]